MRILDLHLKAFGHFTDVSLPLVERPGTLHVVLGRNEAGKSTALRAVRALLYGFPERSRDNFLHAKPLVGGRVVSDRPDGTPETHTILRRKGRKNTLLDEAEHTLPEEVLTRALRGVTEAQFVQNHGLTHEGLRAGGRSILEGKGHLGEALFNASLGGQAVRKTLLRYEEESNALFRPKGRQFPLNRALRDFQEAQRRVRGGVVRREAYQAQQAALEDTRSKLSALRGVLHQVGRAVDEANRDLSLLPLIQRLSGLREQLTSAPVAREAVSQDEIDRTTVLGSWFAQNAIRLEEHRAELARIDEKLSRLSPDTGITALPSERMRDIENRKGSLIKSEADRARRLATRDALREALSQEITTMGFPDGTSWKALLLAPGAAARIHSLAQRVGALVTALEQTTREEQAAQRRLDALSEQLGTLPDPPPLAPLAAAIEVAHVLTQQQIQGGDLAKQVATLATHSLQLVSALGLETPALHDGSSLHLLARLPVPDHAAVDRYDRAWNAAKATLDQTQLARARCEANLRDLTEQREALERGARLPSEDTLREARQERDKVWGAIRRFLEGKAATQAPADIAAVTRVRANRDPETKAGQPSPRPETFDAGAYERAVAESDALADRLRWGAERVAQYGSIRAALSAEEGRRDQLRLDEAAGRTMLTQLETEWQMSWRAVGTVARSAEEMRAWLRRFEELQRTLREHAGASAAMTQRVHDESICRQALGVALAASPATKPLSSLPLSGLLAEAKEQLADQQRQREQREGLQQEAAALEARLGDLASIKGAQSQALGDWRRAWTAAMMPLRLTADASSEEAIATLAALANVVSKGEQLEAVETHLATAQHERLELEDLVQPLVQRFDPTAGERPFLETAELLVRAYHRAMRDQELRHELVRDRELRRDDFERDRAQHERNEAELAAMMRRHGVDSFEALRALQTQCLDVQAWKADLRKITREIEAIAEGEPVDDLVERLRNLDASSLRLRREELLAERERLQGDREELQTQLGRLEAGLENQQNRADAAGAAAEAESALAAIKDIAHRVAQLRVASAMLRREIDRYRKDNEGPLLLRANELFPRLTLGHYAELRVGFSDRDEPILRCVRRDGRDVGVEELSDGTQDQLYLALRLASLERQAAAVGPMPLVLDDILIHFDDDRAKAALNVLSEFSKTAQVLFFTHQAHLVSLAKEVVPQDQLDVHDLDALRGLLASPLRSSPRKQPDADLPA